MSIRDHKGTSHFISTKCLAWRSDPPLGRIVSRILNAMGASTGDLIGQVMLTKPLKSGVIGWGHGLVWGISDPTE